MLLNLPLLYSSPRKQNMPMSVSCLYAHLKANTSQKVINICVKFVNAHIRVAIYIFVTFPKGNVEDV